MPQDTSDFIFVSHADCEDIEGITIHEDMESFVVISTRPAGDTSASASKQVTVGQPPDRCFPSVEQSNIFVHGAHGMRVVSRPGLIMKSTKPFKHLQAVIELTKSESDEELDHRDTQCSTPLMLPGHVGLLRRKEQLSSRTQKHPYPKYAAKPCSNDSNTKRLADRNILGLVEFGQGFSNFNAVINTNIEVVDVVS
ncbi:hypothetical protein BJ165DRAFT_1410367 [Panaeolus papilionaceus]|nr:hypothetical protein BJ165DRAFT_1410367 [Panaeolus papilionaceus]